jgi:hypothetical protein
MHPAVADTADSGTALLTFSYLATVFQRNVIGFDPLATMTSRAVDTIPRSVFLELSVPGFLEFLVK